MCGAQGTAPRLPFHPFTLYVPLIKEKNVSICWNLGQSREGEKENREWKNIFQIVLVTLLRVAFKIDVLLKSLEVFAQVRTKYCL